MSNYEAFLKSALINYKNRDIAKRDILSVFSTFNDLRPKLEDFVFNDGTKKSLLQLDGTIPVNYRGSIYNIPVCIWLLDTHPYNPPMVYVRPTSTMVIKSGRNVDMSGKIDIPFLREWKYPNSDLLGMIQILTIVFGEEPPVYSNSQTFNSPHGYSRQGPYPYPTGSSDGYPGVKSYKSSYPTGSSQGKSYTEYPGVSSYKPPYPTGSSDGQYYIGYSAVTANREQSLRTHTYNNSSMARPATSESDVGDITKESDQVSGKKGKQNTENDDCQTSAEDFDIHCDPCFTENNFVEAGGFCLVCKEYFCKACLRYHRKISATKTHKILEKEHMPKQ